MRKRKIMQYAGMFVIKLIPADMEDMQLKVGDEIDIDDLVILKPTKKKEASK